MTASLVDRYQDLAPAHLVLVCGVFADVSDAGIKPTIGVCTRLCETGGTVVRNRHRGEPERVPLICLPTAHVRVPATVCCGTALVRQRRYRADFTDVAHGEVSDGASGARMVRAWRGAPGYPRANRSAERAPPPGELRDQARSPDGIGPSSDRHERAGTED
ncbi:hypothetical protein [Streptomyces sp. SID5643]|uniref:hypothetical protein n=1 Tax=Streptomyces sp. SID5643 TaxID=2690307 RepID=UPI001367D982|nr:hypothetical protein [Streptomyces sp. SID5643]MZF89695.1 hypothetical protein [Streptomyces sp. SID5643]